MITQFEDRTDIIPVTWLRIIDIDPVADRMDFQGAKLPDSVLDKPREVFRIIRVELPGINLSD